MNINNLINNKGSFVINEINQGVSRDTSKEVSKEELAQLGQALENWLKEEQELKNALEDLKRGLEAGKPGAVKTTASALVENIGAGTLANVLGSSAMAIIQKLAGM